MKERIALEQVHSDTSSFSQITPAAHDADMPVVSGPIRGMLVASLFSLTFWLLSFVTWELLA